ncbi:disease resistance protein RPS2-like [Punica granatum]|uniref:Uncharacterized protein n=2 Tax=Punica granatum TaxID=22663 RepID=A0A2I0L2H6_PUNGR|nr:disease resistance protein RPS2-like [Punica granatum]PKI74911.1 hypothetical protein CRG98_004683 [Punica granatum]
MAEAVVTATASAVAVEAYKDGRSLFGYISRKFDYASAFEDNYRRLTYEAGKLYARGDDVKAEINANKTKRASKECQLWMCRVEEMESEVSELQLKYQKEIKRRSGFHRFLSRSNLSRCMAKKFEEVHALMQEGKLDNGILVDRPPDHVRILDAPTTIDKPSLHWAVEEILGFLREKNVKRIGLWGMVGTGKTTVMQNLNNNELVAQMFDIVIWVTVSKSWSVEKLQDAIRQRLNLKFDGPLNPIETAQRISKELENTRYLLLLDELWGSIDLAEIGIRDNIKDSRVVLASRFRHVCCEMNVDELVNVKRLSDVDAWRIFEEKVGRDLKLPGIKPIAQQVVKECVGLPLLIDRVARAFKKKDNVHLWRDGLRSLRRWPSVRIQGMDEVLEFLRYCYEDLDSHDKKFCFLYGALFPEDCEIFVDYLLECWKAEGYTDDPKFRDARDRGHNILHDLVSVSLLERSEKRKHIRMNKVIRSMALKISSQSRDDKVLVRTSEGLQEPPNEGEWGCLNRISLMDNKLCRLPDEPNCDNLTTLLLQKNRDLIAIPDAFFLHMQSLRVLDLHETGITSLPSSLSRLHSLRALYLNSCVALLELPPCLEFLQHLEVLDIRGTGICCLPSQIGHLTQLKCLRMSVSNFGLGNPNKGQTRIMEINQFGISNLLMLEELIVDVNPYSRQLDEIFKIVTEQVATFPRLNSLTFFFPEVDCLERFIKTSPSWKETHFAFQFFVGYHDSLKFQILDYFEYQIHRCLKYGKGEGQHPVISEVLRETNVVELTGHRNFLSLSDFGMENMSNLRGCWLEDCEDIECIVDGNSTSTLALESLERMHISNVPQLRSIWKGPVQAGSLGQLTSLILYKCPKLKNIFTGGLIEQLSQLHHLSVEDCDEIEEIIVELNSPNLDPNTLPGLKTIVLQQLPGLRKIATSSSLRWPSLEKIKIISCPFLSRLPFTANNASKLRSIEGEQTWWGSLNWEEGENKHRFESLCIFV